MPNKRMHQTAYTALQPLVIQGRGSGGWSGRDKKGDPPGQLYDMKQDPAEKNNLYTERPEVVARLKRLLESYQQEGRSAP